MATRVGFDYSQRFQSGTSLEARRNSVTSGATPVTILPPNPRRRWCLVQSWETNEAVTHVFLTDNPYNFAISPVIRIMPGDSIVLSATGDMPWTGGIVILGSGTDIVNAVDVGDRPYDYI